MAPQAKGCRNRRSGKIRSLDARSLPSKTFSQSGEISSEPWQTYSPSEVHQIVRDYPGFLYPELLNERRRSAPLKGKPFPFMSMPPELRCEVYRMHLLSSDTIELWPHVRHNVMWSANSRRKASIFEHAKFQDKLKLLRVSRTVHREASAIFYGETEFRFSGINGWMICSTWLNTIGPQHFQCLKRLTIHVPFPGIDHLTHPTQTNVGFNEKACTLRPHQHEHFRHFLVKRGLKIPSEWTYDWSISDIVSRLSTSNLKVLKLVLPPTYYISHGDSAESSSLDWHWKMVKLLKDNCDAVRDAGGYKLGLTIRFVLLKIRDGGQDIQDEFDIEFGTRPWLRRYTGQCKRMIDNVREREWVGAIEYGVHDKDGAYEIMDKETCAATAGSGAILKDTLDENEW
ncbi:hypothetical protein BCR34DRAFT_160345 [Clohesyomyces aquaticus]|uniref:Uncharacterized protein n=1 Tax=Clohesyomyces aquaticus TaxID=1231657 RepID=A0A1Y1YIY0_9PLEO|nr:hypothetical protein BCR34DRAFT_160345 [Clohesyomyces aquaticus]